MKEIFLWAFVPLFFGVGLGTVSQNIFSRNKFIGITCMAISVMSVFLYSYFIHT